MRTSVHGVRAHGRNHFTIEVEHDGASYVFGADADGWLLVDGQVKTAPEAREAATQAYAMALEVWGLGPATALARGLKEDT